MPLTVRSTPLASDAPRISSRGLPSELLRTRKVQAWFPTQEGFYHPDYEADWARYIWPAQLLPGSGSGTGTAGSGGGWGAGAGTGSGSSVTSICRGSARFATKLFL